jgi:hypothetical protein
VANQLDTRYELVHLVASAERELGDGKTIVQQIKRQGSQNIEYMLVDGLVDAHNAAIRTKNMSKIMYNNVQEM